MDPLTPHVYAARRYRDRGFQDAEILPDSDPRTERGRRLAAQMLIVDPEQRKLVESVYGIEYCKLRYPEAYSKTARQRLRDFLGFKLVEPVR